MKDIVDKYNALKGEDKIAVASAIGMSINTKEDECFCGEFKVVRCRGFYKETRYKIFNASGEGYWRWADFPGESYLRKFMEEVGIKVD